MRKASDIIIELFGDKFGTEFAEAGGSAAGLFSSWPVIIADAWPRFHDEKKSANDIPAAAVHSRIRELERGILLVEADHPGWLQILQTQQAELLQAAQCRYRDLDIRGIAFRLGRDPGGKNGTEKREEGGVAGNENRELSQRQYGGDRSEARKPEDEEFYTALKKLEESIKKRNNL
jgi:hypothetical protein